MTPQLTLFILRLVGASVLLTFLGIIFWYLRQDLKAIRSFNLGQSAGLGILKVIASATGDPEIGAYFELSPLTSIGRNNRNSIVLNDNFVSADHALLSWRESQWWIEDLGSRNGTKLNDIALTDPVVLSAGDIITIGDIKLKLEMFGKSEEEKVSGIRDSNP